MTGWVLVVGGALLILLGGLSLTRFEAPEEIWQDPVDDAYDDARDILGPCDCAVCTTDISAEFADLAGRFYRPVPPVIPGRSDA